VTATFLAATLRRGWLGYVLAASFVVAATGLGRAVASEWSARAVTPISSRGRPSSWPHGLEALVPACSRLASRCSRLCSIEPFAPCRLQGPGDLLAASTFGACGVIVTVLTESLHRARRKEERARRAREEVLEIVAHDLRSPLNVVLFTTARLRRRPEGLADSLDKLERAGRRIEHLIRDLLDASVLDRHGHLSMTFREEDVAALVAESVLAASGPAGEKSITIATEIAAAFPGSRAARSHTIRVATGSPSAS
jgi:signal transduction histidine kinase